MALKTRIFVYLASLSFILLISNFLKGIVKKIVSNAAYFDAIDLRLLLVILLIFAIIVFEVYLKFFSKIAKHEFLIYFLIICFFIVLNLVFQFRIYPITDFDVSEYSRCGFFVSEGKIPYLDFFEHHNTFYCFLISPVFNIFKGIYSVYAIFILAWIFFILSSILVYKIGKHIFKSHRYALWSAIFFVSFKYALISYEGRPDVITSFLLLSAFYLFITQESNKQYFFIGLIIGFSFLLSQKALFFLVMFPMAVLVKSRDFAQNFKQCLSYCLGLCIPIGILLSYLFYHGLEYAKLYYFLNFTFNNQIKWGGLLTYYLPNIIIANGITLVLILLGIPMFISAIKNKQIDRKSQLVIAMNSILILFFLYKNRLMPDDPIYMFPLISILSVYSMRSLNNKIPSKVKPHLSYIFFVLLFFPVMLNIALFMYLHPNQASLVNFYLNNYKGEKSNCNFIFNPTTQYHDFFNNNETRKLLKDYGIISDYPDEEDLIKEDIKIICTKRTDPELTGLLIKSGYMMYDIKDYYGYTYYYKIGNTTISGESN